MMGPQISAGVCSPFLQLPKLRKRDVHSASQKTDLLLLRCHCPGVCLRDFQGPRSCSVLPTHNPHAPKFSHNPILIHPTLIHPNLQTPQPSYTPNLTHPNPHTPRLPHTHTRSTPFSLVTSQSLPPTHKNFSPSQPQGIIHGTPPFPFLAPTLSKPERILL